MTPLLEVRGLTTRFHTSQGVVHAVSDVSWSLNAGESIAIVGESGSGKSVSALSLMGLVPPPGLVECHAEICQAFRRSTRRLGNPIRWRRFNPMALEEVAVF